MSFGFSFTLLLTNWTLQDVPVIDNIGSALKCASLTKLTCKTSFIYNDFSKQCTINPEMIPSTENMTFSPDSVYFFSKAPSSCKDIQTCRTVQNDGEYWLYPDAYGNKIETKIYCNDMMTKSPKEYLTLHALNFAEHPAGRYTSASCALNTHVFSRTGKTEFSKIRINQETMTIDPEDYRFTNQIYGKQRPYGIAYGCSLNFRNCPPRASAVLNITLTGLVFDAENEWEETGLHAKIEVTVRTDQQVSILGDGFCGGANITRPIKVLPDPNYKPPKYTAKEM